MRSAARLINGERLVVLGWGRAILLQLAHPLVAAGVDDHSTFRAHPLAPVQRLHATIQTMLALTFGTPADMAGAAQRINRIHDRVHGTLGESAGRFRAGTPYSAHDPELLAWVELTLLDSLPLAYETFIGPLSGADKDAWCLEARANADLLGVPPESIPLSYEALHADVENRIRGGELAVGAVARRLARSVLYSPLVSLAWPWSRLNRIATIGLLPPAIRDGYGLTWTKADARALDRWARACRTVAARTPATVRRWRAARRGHGPM
jgi:uncharacterized protein (DUF2236 family)